MIRTLIITALAVVAVADFASHTVYARDLAADTVSVRVRYADLDLTSRQGATVMAARIRNAARDICGGDETGYADLSRRRLARACVQDTSARAAAGLGAPIVTAMVTGDPAVVMAAR